MNTEKLWSCLEPFVTMYSMCDCMGLINVSSTKINCQITLSEAMFVMQLFIINSKSKCNPFTFKHFLQCYSKARHLHGLHISFHLKHMANLFLYLILAWHYHGIGKGLPGACGLMESLWAEFLLKDHFEQQVKFKNVHFHRQKLPM